MSECRWTSSTTPRVVNGEHYDACDDETCGGCWPCLEPHCGNCRREHGDAANPVTCPTCVGHTREDLSQIATMIGAPLLAEVIHRPVNSEAFMLNGPAADSEIWQRRQRLIVNAAVVADNDTGPEHKAMIAWLSDCRDELHPLWVLGTWENVWRDHLEQPSDAKLTVPQAVAYLVGHLTNMAQVEEPDFAQFAGEVRACRSHMQGVLHDQNEGDRANVSCFECGGALERKLRERRPGGPLDDRGGFEDRWTCARCRRVYTYAEYNFALRARLEENTKEGAAS